MTLQEYLETKLGEMASQDPNFRERYEDKKKSMKDCLLYVTQQARKQAIRKAELTHSFRSHRQQAYRDRRGKLAADEGSSVLRCLRQVHALSRPHCQSRQQQHEYD